MADRSAGLAGALAALIALGLAGFCAALSGRLPPALWLEAVFAPGPADLPQLLVHHSMLPRAAVALLAGAGLALAGVTFQQALRNPLASPSTLGVSAGAHLALSIAAISGLELAGLGREGVALAGAGVAAAFVLALSIRARFAPLAVILAGMITGMLCGAASGALALFNERLLTGLFVWGSGSLNQQDWSVAASLAPKLLLGAAALALLARPLALLDFGDQARNLGLSVAQTRFACLAVAVALTAVVVSAVGVVGFVGLAAPALARALGARTVARRLAWGPALGAALLFATDGILQAIDMFTGVSIPTGAATALIGAPTLLWLVPRLAALSPPEPGPSSRPGVRTASGSAPLALLACAVCAIGLLSLGLGRSPDGGFALAAGETFRELVPWRWPRALAAVSAGAMLAAAGVMMQRLTGNPIASPEVLGVSSGAALGVMAALFGLSAPGYGAQALAATLGAFAVALALLAIGRNRAFGGEQLLLAGIALGAGVNAVIAIVMASGDPRAMLLANWMAGSTYDVEPGMALTAAALAVAGLAGSAALVRWLALAPLGPAAMAAVGASPGRARLTIVAAAAALSAVATLAVGPLSFAGLIAPHLALRLGFVSAGRQLAGAALIGALVMASADWLGRTIYFPFQVPAGLIGMALAAPLLIWLLRAR